VTKSEVRKRKWEKCGKNISRIPLIAPVVYLVKKKIQGKEYLYLEERAWIDGRSKRIWQKYLGPATRIREASFTLHPEKVDYQTLAFGGSAALLQMARKIRLVETIDRYTDKTRDQGLSVGEYLLIAIINRCVKPTTKTRLGKWFEQDYLSRLLEVDDPKTLNSQTYWNHFQYFSSPETLEKIERELAQTVLDEFQLELSCLLFDPTNFFTFLSEHNGNGNGDNNPRDDDDQDHGHHLAQFGHSKENRNNLRIVNLSLLCTMDAGIPLFHRTYAGNTQDAKHFRGVLGEIFDRFQFLNREVEELTLVFDKGNHSQEAFDMITDMHLGVIASLRNSTQKDLITLPDDAFTFMTLPGNAKEVGYYRTSREVYGIARTVYVIHDPRRHKRQLVLFERKLEAKLRAVHAFLEARLNVKKWRTEEEVSKKLKALIGKQQPFREIIEFEISGAFGALAVHITVNESAKAVYCRTLGRSVIFTTREDWSPETVIQSFRHKSIVEDVFKHLKNPSMLAIRPMYHWADECIRVHVFCCVIGFLLLALLRRVLQDHDVTASYSQLLDAFDLLKVTVVRSSSTAPSITKLNRVDGLAAQLLEVLRLDRFLT